MTRKQESSFRQLRNHADMVWRRSCADADWYAGAQGKPDFLRCNKEKSFANRAIVPDNPEWDAFIKNCLRYDPAQKPSATLPRCEAPCIIFHAHTMAHRGRNG